MFSLFNKKEKVEKEENFNFQDYLTEVIGYEEIDKGRFYKKHYKTIKILKNGVMFATNTSKKVRHSHIVTCRVPENLNDAEVLTRLTHLNR